LSVTQDSGCLQESALLVFTALVASLGRAFEPHGLPLLATVLERLADKEAP
jgi:hypothetical protein